MRIVFDTNILVSAVAFPGGPPSDVFGLARASRLQAFVSPAILAELAGVLQGKLRFADNQVLALGQLVAQACTLVQPQCRVEDIVSNPKDNRLLELALEVRADYIITGNLRHVRSLGEWRGIRVRTAREFLDELQGEID